MRYRPGQPPSFAPRLPPALTRLTFTVFLRGRRLRVEVLPASATYVLDGDGPPLEITHHGTPVSVTPDQPVTRDIPGQAARPRPSQPPGREPVRRARDEPGRADQRAIPQHAGPGRRPPASDPSPPGVRPDRHAEPARGRAAAPGRAGAGSAGDPPATDPAGMICT